MKTWQLQVNDRDYVVEIENPNANPTTVRVNGKVFQVAMSEVGMTARPTSVAAVTTEDQDFQPYIPDVISTFVQTSEPEAPAAGSQAAAPAPSGQVETVIAPMPGKIMDIVAKVGDKVKHGDALCYLEAMKMKSPIRSTADGVVVQVVCQDGQSVGYGDALFKLG